MLTCSHYTILALSAHSCDKNTTCSTAHVHVLRQSIECPTIERKMVYIVRLCATCVREPTIMCMKSRENQDWSCGVAANIQSNRYDLSMELQG